MRAVCDFFVSSPKIRVKLVEFVETNSLRQAQASLPLLFGGTGSVNPVLWPVSDQAT